MGVLLLGAAAVVHAAGADGGMSDGCAESLASFMESDCHPKAAVRWLRLAPPKKGTLTARLRKEPARTRLSSPEFRSFMAMHVRFDGQPGPKKIAAVEEVYKALGVEESMVYSDLHGGDGLVKVADAEPDAGGGAISPEGVDLDEGRIAAVRSDTERASELLGDVFNGGDGDALQAEMERDVARLAAEPGVEVDAGEGGRGAGPDRPARHGDGSAQGPRRASMSRSRWMRLKSGEVDGERSGGAGGEAMA